MPTASLILPFAVPVKERVKAFTPSMELAVIMFLTEARRRKPGILEAKPEETSSVSRLHYPLWAVPWEGESLIIDGLGAFSSKISLQVLPDLAIFIRDIERGLSVQEQFWTVLGKHEKTFKDFAKSSDVQMNALIMDEELLSTLFEYVRETVSRNLMKDDTVVLAPLRLDQEEAVESAAKMSELHRQIQSDMRGLEYARNLLEEASKSHEQMILKEIEQTRESYETEISKFKPSVDKKVDQLLKERDARIAKINRTTENELKAKERERERRERELQSLELSKSDYSKRRAARKRRKDKIGVTHWEHRIRVYENKIEELKARIHALSEFAEKTRRQSETDAEKLTHGYQALIDKEKRKIIEVEVQRDRDVEAKQKKIEKLRFATGNIVSQIAELTERKRSQENELKKSTIDWQFDDVSLICMPFYLACYKAGKKTEFQVFPPFRVMGSEGIVKTLQKTIRSLRPSSRMNLFLQPRSKVLDKALDFVFEEKAKSEKAFNDSLLQAAISSNVLGRQDFKETLTKGVEELKGEGWISQKQGNALIRAYA